MIDEYRLEALLKRSNQLPASERLISWARRCLARDGRDMDEIDRQLNRSKLEHHWPFLKKLLSEKDLVGMMTVLAKELDQEASRKLAASGFRVRQQITYKGKDNRILKFFKGKILTIKSIQIVDGEIWFTCYVPDSLEQTFKIDYAQKVY